MRRNVHADQTILMGKPFADPNATVYLRLPNGQDKPFRAGTLNQEFHRQQAAYAADTYFDPSDGQWYGRSTGRLRPSGGQIRKVYVGDLLAGTNSSARPAA